MIARDGLGMQVDVEVLGGERETFRIGWLGMLEDSQDGWI